MNIRIKSITLDNFKCFRHLEFQFSEEVTIIRGRNGAGKTTIADAILWCLFGKNLAGQSDFDLKTHDDNGSPIPHLDHSVELEIEKDGRAVITLKRTLKETWLKKRGSDEQVFKSNTTEYMINGEVVTATDYKKYIADLVSEDVFRAITNPSYFPSLKWQQQREFLTKMVGELTEENYAGAEDDSELYSFRRMLAEQNEDIIAYRKHLSYQIKKVKEKLDKIPVRLEEQYKALPERLDWFSLKKDSENLKADFAGIEEKILAIKSGNGADVKKEELRAELDAAMGKELEIRQRYQTVSSEETAKRDEKVNELSRKFNSLLNTQHDIEAQLGSFDALKRRCQDTLDRCEEDAQEIREKWAEVTARKLEWDDDNAICPTCGQYLPAEQLQQKKREALEKLNTEKDKAKQKLTAQAEKVKALRAETRQTMDDYDTQKQQSEGNLASVKQQINDVFSQKQEALKIKVSSWVSMLEKDDEYQSVKNRIEDLSKQIKEASVTSDEDKKALDELEEKKRTVNEELTTITNQLATEQQYIRIEELIDGIKAEERDLIAQLSNFEKAEDVAKRYQDRQNALIEERINRHFRIVRWRMFRTVNNGGDPFDEPYCECYVDGVAYHDGLNQAARLNAGLDIINTLCKHYEITAPIVIDNAESNLDILPTASQQIRLEVYDSELTLV